MDLLSSKNFASVLFGIIVGVAAKRWGGEKADELRFGFFGDGEGDVVLVSVWLGSDIQRCIERQIRIDANEIEFYDNVDGAWALVNRQRALEVIGDWYVSEVWNAERVSHRNS